MIGVRPSGAAPAPPPLLISVFDLDRTLTRHGTYLRFLVFAAARLRPWRLAGLPLVLGGMGAYKLGVFGRARLKEVMHSLLLGSSLGGADARRLAARFAERLVGRGLHPQGRAQIDADLAAGRLVVIATAAPELYARPLALRLGVAHVVATRSMWAEGRLLARIDGLNCYGPEKLARFEGFLSEQGLARSDVRVRVLSDDASDLPMFEWCDDPVAVNPTPRLRALARRRGWLTIDWRSRGGSPDARDVPDAGR